MLVKVFIRLYLSFFKRVLFLLNSIIVQSQNTGVYFDARKSRLVVNKMDGFPILEENFKIIDLNSESSYKNVSVMFENIQNAIINKIDRNEKLAKVDPKDRDYYKKKRKEDLIKY